MRLVISIFDHCSAYRNRQDSRAFVSNSAVAGYDLASLDTYTGLPYELELAIVERYHDLRNPVKLPPDIWQDLSKPDSFLPASTCLSHDQDQRSHTLNANAASFTPGQDIAPKKNRGISETIQPVFAPLRSLDWRFGHIQIDYLEAPVRMTYQQQYPPQGGTVRSPMSPSRTLELPAIFEMRKRSNTDEVKDKPPDEARSSPGTAGSGTLDLGFGVIHLYKDPLDGQEKTTDEGKKSEKIEGAKKVIDSTSASDTTKPDAGTMVAILGVPSNWSTADLLTFIDDSVDSLHQMRIMR